MSTTQTELARCLEKDLAEGLSRRDIAKKAHVSEGTIRNALEGKPLTHEVLDRLARFYFKVPIDDMYRMAGLFPPESNSRTAAIRLIEHLFEQLPDSDQQEIIEIIRLKIARQEKR